MLKVVHVSSNPVSGSPYELNKLLNTKSSTFQSRLVQGTYQYIENNDISKRTFPFDLLWNENKEEAIQLIKSADIIHIHNSIFPENLQEYINKNQKIVLQLYSVYREKLQPFINDALKLNPTIIIADQAWQKQVYQDLSSISLPLVKNNFAEISKNSIPTIVYAPTNRLPLSHMYSKGYYEVLEILYRLKQKFNFVLKIVEGIPYEDNLKDKMDADIIIDDVINKDAFHGTSLEAACYGAVPITNYTGTDYPFKKTCLKNLEQTLVLYLTNPSILEYDKDKIKNWQVNNYTQELLLEKYETFYNRLILTDSTQIENISNPYEQSERMEKTKTYLYQKMTDWLDSNKIPFFLSFGSALKSYRDNEHALDADFGVLSEYKWKVREAIVNNLPSEIMINCIWRGEITFRLKSSNYPKLDIIFFDKQTDFYRCNIYSKNPFTGFVDWERGLKISHNSLSEFISFNFKNRTVLLPKNIEPYLTENYSDEWRTPIPNKTMGWGSRPCADYDHRQIAIIVPTFMRPEKIKQCVDSILCLYPENIVRIYIGDQSENISDEMKSYYGTLETKGHKYFKLPYNCGLSYARNYLVKQTQSEPYIMIIDDDFIFTKSTDLWKFINVLEEKEEHGICGGNLEGRHHYAGWLSYHPHIKKILKTDIFAVPQEIKLTTEYPYRQQKVSYYYSDIVLNFFLAKKEIFKDCLWDDALILAEHTDFFLRLKDTKWKVCYSPEVTIKHSILENDATYAQFRHTINKNIGIERFCKKWNLNNLDDIFRMPTKTTTKKETIPIPPPQKVDIKETNETKNIFREVTDLFTKEEIAFALMHETCREVVKTKSFLGKTTHIYFGLYIPAELSNTLQKMGYIIEKDTLIKNSITIHILPPPEKTKKWRVDEKVFNVPFPLISYLQQLFGENWEKS